MMCSRFYSRVLDIIPEAGTSFPSFSISSIHIYAVKMAEVKSWLANFGMQKYGDDFVSKGWDTFESLKLMSLDEVKEIVPLPGHSKLIYSRIQGLNASTGGASTSTQNTPREPQQSASSSCSVTPSSGSRSTTGELKECVLLRATRSVASQDRV